MIALVEWIVSMGTLPPPLGTAEELIRLGYYKKIERTIHPQKFWVTDYSSQSISLGHFRHNEFAQPCESVTRSTKEVRDAFRHIEFGLAQDLLTLGVCMLQANIWFRWPIVALGSPFMVKKQNRVLCLWERELMWVNYLYRWPEHVYFLLRC